MRKVKIAILEQHEVVKTYTVRCTRSPGSGLVARLILMILKKELKEIKYMGT